MRLKHGVPAMISFGATSQAAAPRRLVGGPRPPYASTAAAVALETATVTAQALGIVVLAPVTATATAAATLGRLGRVTADTLRRLRPVS